MGFIAKKESKIAPETKKEIIRALANGVTPEDIASMYEISEDDVISFIKTNSDKIDNVRTFIRSNKGGE